MSKGKHSSQYKREKSKKRSVENDENVQNINNLGENIKELFNKAVEDWKAKYDSEILALKMELEKVKKDFISLSYEKLKNRCQQLVETNQNQEEQIRKLKAQTNELESCNEKEKEKVDFLINMRDDSILKLLRSPLKKEKIPIRSSWR